MIVANGATLQVQQIANAALALGAYPLTVIGTGYTAGTTGAIEMLGGGTGINTLSGAVTLIGDTTIGVDVGQLTMSGIISGAAAITKVGLGMLSLGGANTYNGIDECQRGHPGSQRRGGPGGDHGRHRGGQRRHAGRGGVAVVGEPVTLNGTGFGTLPRAAFRACSCRAAP